MNSTQSKVSDSNATGKTAAPQFENDVKSKDQQAWPKDQTKDTANKRYDHHLIDHDLELEDKNGRRLNPKAEQKGSRDNP